MCQAKDLISQRPQPAYRPGERSLFDIDARGEPTLEALIAWGDWRALFIEHLGWDHSHGTATVEINGRPVELLRIAQKRGLQVFAHRAPRARVQTRPYLYKLEQKTSQLSHEHLLIVRDEALSVQVWIWSYRDRKKDRWRHRLHPCFSRRIPPAFIDRVAGLLTSLDEEESLSLMDVTARVAERFDDAADQKVFFRNPKYAEESDRLARRMRSGGTAEFQNFVLFHRGLAGWFARRYRFVTDELEDLEQAAMVGILRAARSFDVAQRVSFSTYAFRAMQTDCQRYLCRALRLGRMPDNLYAPFQRILRRCRQARTMGGPPAEQRAFRRAVKREDFSLQLAETVRRFMQPISLHPAGLEEQASLLGAVEYEDGPDADYRDPPSELILTERARHLRELIASLDARSGMILRRRFGLDGPEQTLEMIGGELGVTRERIRQIEKKALFVLRQRWNRSEYPTGSLF